MSSAAELGEAGEEDRAERQGEPKQDLHDEQGPELAVVGVHLEGAGRVVADLAGDVTMKIWFKYLLPSWLSGA
ncbi:hypothetical protein BH20PSE1_BH20PSE1_15160 [soil metagenome]